MEVRAAGEVKEAYITAMLIKAIFFINKFLVTCHFCFVHVDYPGTCAPSYHYHIWKTKDYT